MDVSAKVQGGQFGELLKAAGGGKGSLMIGIFDGHMRSNLGEYEGDVDPLLIKQRFFQILGRRLGVSGQPKKIGNLAQAYGHPETGWPEKSSTVRQGNSGCAPVILFCIGVGGLGAWGLSFV